MSALPLVIYLDTQDYIRIFNEKDNGSAHQILEKLLAYRDDGKIVIGYSWATLLEFITRPTDDFRQERVRRGQLIKDICGRNAFPFLSDLKHGARFPNDGFCFTNKNDKFISAKRLRHQIEKRYLALLSEEKNLNREQRRRLRTPSAMRQHLSESASTWGTRREDFKGIPVSDEFVKSGIMNKFLKGICSDSAFEERINQWLSDPAEFSRIFYDYADKPNLINEISGSSLDQIETALKDFHDAKRNLESKIQGFRKSLIDSRVDNREARRLTKSMQLPTLDIKKVVRRVEEHIGEGRAAHLEHYMVNATKIHYDFKRSDLMDVMQMCYVQDCDLFRCDKAMADLDRNYEPFAGKIVSKFTDLPLRIEERLSHLAP